MAPFALGNKPPSRVGWMKSDLGFVPKLKLVCLHHAGGSSVLFRGWQAALAKERIEVLAVELPGRGRRIGEPSFRILQELVSCLFLEVRREAALGTPIALFGVSFGSLVAYELAHALEEAGIKVQHLIASSFCAPSLYKTQKPEKIADKTDTELIEYIRVLGGTPEELLSEPEWMEFFLPMIRSDFQLMDSHAFAAKGALKCPVTAIGSTGDDDYPPASVAQWGTLTNGPFRHDTVEGNHLYLASEPEKALAILRQVLA